MYYTPDSFREKNILKENVQNQWLGDVANQFLARLKEVQEELLQLLFLMTEHRHTAFIEFLYFPYGRNLIWLVLAKFMSMNCMVEILQANS